MSPNTSKFFRNQEMMKLNRLILTMIRTWIAGHFEILILETFSSNSLSKCGLVVVCVSSTYSTGWSRSIDGMNNFVTSRNLDSGRVHDSRSRGPEIEPGLFLDTFCSNLPIFHQFSLNKASIIINNSCRREIRFVKMTRLTIERSWGRTRLIPLQVFVQNLFIFSKLFKLNLIFKQQFLQLRNKIREEHTAHDRKVLRSNTAYSSTVLPNFNFFLNNFHWSII